MVAILPAKRHQEMYIRPPVKCTSICSVTTECSNKKLTISYIFPLIKVDNSKIQYSSVQKGFHF